MKKQYINILAIGLTIISIILLMVLIIVKTNKFKKQTSDSDLNSKIISEISFIDADIIETMNKLNNISIPRYKVYTKTINKSSEESSNSDNEEKKDTKDNNDSTEQEKKENNIDKANSNKNQISVSETVTNNSFTETQNEKLEWNYITHLYENLYSAWPTISMDLKKAGINEENISKFNVDLNGLAQSINSKDKNTALVNLFNLYAMLPKYASAVCKDRCTVINYNTKLAILNAYTLANEDNKWQEMSQSIVQAKKEFEKIMNEPNYQDSKRTEAEKTYSIINDLENSIVLNDKNIFYMNYKNTIQSLETL